MERLHWAAVELVAGARLVAGRYSKSRRMEQRAFCTLSRVAAMVLCPTLGLSPTQPAICTERQLKAARARLRIAAPCSSLAPMEPRQCSTPSRAEAMAGLPTAH